MRVGFLADTLPAMLSIYFVTSLIGIADCCGDATTLGDVHGGGAIAHVASWGNIAIAASIVIRWRFNAVSVSKTSSRSMARCGVARSSNA